MSDAIVGWITLGANVSVVVGLVLVAIQIRQNTRSVRASSYQTWVASATEWNLGIATNRDLASAIVRGHGDPADLDEQTALQYAMSMLAVMQMIQSTYYLYRDRSIDQSLWEAERQRAALHLSFAGVRQWWDAGAKTQLSPEFVKVVEDTPITSGAWSWQPSQGFLPFPGSEADDR